VVSIWWTVPGGQYLMRWTSSSRWWDCLSVWSLYGEAVSLVLDILEETFLYIPANIYITFWLHLGFTLLLKKIALSTNTVFLLFRIVMFFNFFLN
jgi:hypothetical protein